MLPVSWGNMGPVSKLGQCLGAKLEWRWRPEEPCWLSIDPGTGDGAHLPYLKHCDGESFLDF